MMAAAALIPTIEAIRDLASAALDPDSREVYRYASAFFELLPDYGAIAQKMAGDIRRRRGAQAQNGTISAPADLDGRGLRHEQPAAQQGLEENALSNSTTVTRRFPAPGEEAFNLSDAELEACW